MKIAICKPNEIKINNKIADLPAQVLNFGVYEKDQSLMECVNQTAFRETSCEFCVHHMLKCIYKIVVWFVDCSFFSASFSRGIKF